MMIKRGGKSPDLTVILWICCLSDKQELASVFWSLECPCCSQQCFVSSIRTSAEMWLVNVFSSPETHLLAFLLHLTFADKSFCIFVWDTVTYRTE